MKNMELLKTLETAQNELHSIYDSVKARQAEEFPGKGYNASRENIDTKTAMVRRLITVRQLCLKARREIEEDY